MKGISLPINVLVIIAIAVIILLALVALYFTGFGPFSTAVGLEGIRGENCRKLAQEQRCAEQTWNIDVVGFDANQDNALTAGATWDWAGFATALAAEDTSDFCGLDATSSNDNLAALCGCYYNIDTESACRRLCGCT